MIKDAPLSEIVHVGSRDLILLFQYSPFCQLAMEGAYIPINKEQCSQVEQEAHHPGRDADRHNRDLFTSSSKSNSPGNGWSKRSTAILDKISRQAEPNFWQGNVKDSRRHLVRKRHEQSKAQR
jgi:hypothetical protein